MEISRFGTSVDLSWNQSEEEVVKSFSKGQEVEAVILGIDPHKERISWVSNSYQKTFSILLQK